MKIKTSKFGELLSPPGQKFDLEIGQTSRSRHGANGKGLSQGSFRPNIHTCTIIFYTTEDIRQVKEIVTDGWTDRRRDRRTNEF